MAEDSLKHLHLTSLRIERRGIALHITLDRRETKNAISADVVEEYLSVADCLTHDPSRAVVLRGAGGVFCSGGDIRGFAESASSPKPDFGWDPIAQSNGRFGILLQKLSEAPQVVISVVEGPAFGGGFGLACASEIVIASADARFSLSETTLGVIPAQIAPFVVRRIGLRNAKRLALTAARFDGKAAESYGIVDQLCSSSTSVESALNEVLIAIRACAPEANAATKRLLTQALHAPIGDILATAAIDFATALRSEGQEGAAAFLEKRKPRWMEEEA